MTNTFIIKRYANRKLYDTELSRYTTVEELGKMVVTGEKFLVIDDVTGRDMTREILAQVVVQKASVMTKEALVSFIREAA